ncbi:hypothetical protein [Anabaena sp. CCY 9910]|uniref:hypothetical protein n=1 Tax=Anabaena sp. CCY 9910 TaxID=3103870 RepID=UPI0039DF5C3A
MVKDSTSLQLKNHVSPRGKSLNRALQQKFDITIQDLTDACLGDEKKAKAIGEKARQAGLIKDLMPKFRDAYIQIIEGTQEYNESIAKILTTAGKSGIAIDKAVTSTILGNKEYENQRQELAQQLINGRNAENQRHAYAMNHAQMKAYIDAFLVGVEQKTSIIEQSNRPELKQIDADEAYQRKVINHVLAEGDNSRVDLIPQKNYQPNTVKGFLVEKFSAVKNALGF